jgi:hypothetical protein
MAVLLAGPAFAFGSMGGMGGGMGGGFHGGHGGFHASSFHAPPPPANVRPPLPLVGAPPPNPHIRTGFVTVHFPHDQFFHDHDRHHGRGGSFAGWPLGWGGGYGVYATGASEPAYEAPPAPPPAQVAEGPVCPELISWSPKLGHATRQRLCDEPDGHADRG